VKILLSSFFCVSLLVSGSAMAQNGENGHVQANAATIRGEQDVPPPVSPQAKVDRAQLQREADELTLLAQSVRSDMQQVAKGVFPHELNQKLKRIEKLSKRLRADLGQ
jgi:hypothetical protein